MRIHARDGLFHDESNLRITKNVGTVPITSILEVTATSAVTAVIFHKKRLDITGIAPGSQGIRSNNYKAYNYTHMTKSDYGMVTGAIRGEVEFHTTPGGQYEAQVDVIGDLAARLATRFKEHDARFDRDSFYDACGLSQTIRTS